MTGAYCVGQLPQAGPGVMPPAVTNTLRTPRVAREVRGERSHTGPIWDGERFGGERGHEPVVDGDADGLSVRTDAELLEDPDLVILDGLEGDPQPTSDGFGRQALHHRRQYLGFAGREAAPPG